MNAIAAGALFSLMACAAAAGPINVARGDAPQTLKQWSSQADINVIFDYPELQGITTLAIANEKNRYRALNRMLKGTGLTYEHISSQTVSIFKRAAPVAIVVCVKHDGTRICTKARVPK